MTRRTLTITLRVDWRGALRAAGTRAVARSYQGEVRNFETAGSFFGRLTQRRRALVHALQGRGAMSVREPARRVGRDVRRVHDDMQVLSDLGFIERTDTGGVECPFETINVDIRLIAPEPLA
jgi:predicted transcriptional regulator